MSCISYNCYINLSKKPEIKTIHARVISVDRSNLGSLVMIAGVVNLGSCTFNHQFIVCENLLWACI